MTEDTANIDRADWRTEQGRAICEAAGITPGDLPEQADSVVRWLAGWDEHTVNGIVKLLMNARGAAVLETQRAVLDAMESEWRRVNGRCDASEASR